MVANGASQTARGILSTSGLQNLAHLGTERPNAHVGTVVSLSSESAPMKMTSFHQIQKVQVTLSQMRPQEVNQVVTDHAGPRLPREVDAKLQIIEEVIGKDSTIFKSDSSFIPVLSAAKVDSDLDSFLQPKPKTVMLDQWTQVGAANNSMIRLLREAKAGIDHKSEWEFINYSPHQISTWEGDYQNHIWAVDHRIFGVTKDSEIHTFKLPRKKVAPSPATVRDALRDKILNNGKNLPEDELLATQRSRGLGQNPSERLHTWDKVGTTYTRAGTPCQRDPPWNYGHLIQNLKDQSLQDGE